jgi:DMSO/TMAO reductase YedYZ molybdopterin-dependent catalytic subunit
VKPRSNSVTSLSILFITILAVSACGGQPSTEPAITEPTGTVLSVVGPNGGHTLNLAQLKALPATEGLGGIKSSTGKITLPESFKGVAIKDLVAYLGVSLDPSMGVVITAEDGYSMTFSYDQVKNGTFIAYDPALGNEISSPDPLTAIIAYEHNGQPLNSTEEGILRLMVVSATNNQVVDGHWSVKWVNKVEVKSIGENWTLDLQGSISASVTRDSYQSCGSPGCHGTSWEEENGQTWVGVPLWLLIGEVDDEDSHTENAYNHSIAEAGYLIDLYGSSGDMVSLNSQSMDENNELIVAFMVNDGELPEQFYPLRLVGAGLENSQMIGKITRIVANIPPSPTPTVAAVVENPGVLAISGLVNTELSLTDADLRAMGLSTINAVGKDGPQDFHGVLLNQILDQAGLKDEASKLVFTASDDYTAEVALTDVRECPKALLAFMETPGIYMIVLPDQTTSTWVKNVISIEVK